LNHILKVFAFLSLSTFFIACAYIVPLISDQEQITCDLSELENVVNNAKDNTTILIKEGTFSDVNIRIRKRVDNSIMIKPISNGKVHIKGKSTLLILSSSNIILEGFLFDEVSGPPIVIDDSNNIEIRNNYFLNCGVSPTHSIVRIKNASNNNKIYNNTFDGNRALGIVIPTDKNNPRDLRNVDNEIFGNYFLNIPSVNSVYPGSNGNGMEAIQIGLDFEETINNDLRTKVYRNLFENIIGDAIEIISNKSSGNEIFENTFLNNRSGVVIRSGNRVTIRNNYLINTLKGIRVYGADHQILDNYIFNASPGISLPSANFERGGRMTKVGYYQQDNIVIRSNIISGTNRGIVLGDGERELFPIDIKIEKNIILTDKEENNIVTNPKVDVKSIRISRRSDMETDKSLFTNKGDIEIDFEKVIEMMGFEPYNSNDSKVGASWKRPELIKLNIF
jgi:poly(beta-D-mannuronate) lyase